MRDNHGGFAEIINASERKGQNFGAVRVVLSDGIPTIESGISLAGYYSLKRILDARPFDSLPGIPYSQFFRGAEKPDQAPRRHGNGFGCRCSRIRNVGIEAAFVAVAVILAPRCAPLTVAFQNPMRGRRRSHHCVASVNDAGVGMVRSNFA